MMLMVTSLWNHRMLHPRGLVPKLLGLRCQFRGDWSQGIASLSSESDLQARRRSFISHIFFQSYYGHESLISESTSTCGGSSHSCLRGACIFFFTSKFCQFPFVSSQWILWRKVTSGKCGSSSVYNYCYESVKILLKMKRTWTVQCSTSSWT